MGVEKETSFNLNWIETLFRGYDPQLGRFHGIDAMANQMPTITPYQYSFNNPIMLSDPSGLAPNLDEWTKQNEEDAKKQDAMMSKQNGGPEFGGAASSSYQARDEIIDSYISYGFVEGKGHSFILTVASQEEETSNIIVEAVTVVFDIQMNIIHKFYTFKTFSESQHRDMVNNKGRKYTPDVIVDIPGNSKNRQKALDDLWDFFDSDQPVAKFPELPGEFGGIRGGGENILANFLAYINIAFRNGQDSYSGKTIQRLGLYRDLKGYEVGSDPTTQLGITLLGFTKLATALTLTDTALKTLGMIMTPLSRIYLNTNLDVRYSPKDKD